MADSRESKVFCNFSYIPDDFDSTCDILLTHESIKNEFEQNVVISLNDFDNYFYFLKPRYSDLLEIAAYIFHADRRIHRGNRDSLENLSWSRNIHFIINVRDYDFWERNEVIQSLKKALVFMTGDAEYSFTFRSGKPIITRDLLDDERLLVKEGYESQIMLFSGGIDSLAGAISILESEKNTHLHLVSHRSNQPSTSKTQNAIVNQLKILYPKRIHHYKFYCHFKDIHSRDENQRTRAFLYTSIAFSLAKSFGLNNINVFENGVTSINLPKREDMGSARSSRTTHPKTIKLLSEFFSLVGESPFIINTPYLWVTKAEVFEILRKSKKQDLISSSVSCSKTYKNNVPYTHCGECTQCVDRRFAAYSSSLEEYDHQGLYTIDILRNPILGESKTIALDYVRAAQEYSSWSVDKFLNERINEISEILDYVGLDEEECIKNLFDLHKRHGEGVLMAIKRMLSNSYNLSKPFVKGSLLELLATHEFNKTPIELFVFDVINRLDKSIPIIFQTQKPDNENRFNDTIEGILADEKDSFYREHPTINFALSKTVPDHSSNDFNLFIESKYLRNTTTPSVVSDGIAADLTKYPQEKFVLFIIYDPNRAIHNDEKFQEDFESKRPGKCRIHIIR